MVSDARVRELRAGATRHRVMERVLAVQRHDAMGPLSGVRLALAALGRRAGAGTLSNDDLLTRLATIQANVAATVQALLAMRVWDGARGEAIDAERLLADCAGWVRPLATLAQVRLDLPAATAPAIGSVSAVSNDAAATGPPVARAHGPRRFDDVEAVEAHYALLAALLHALDASPAGGAIVIEPADGGVRVCWHDGSAPRAVAPSGDGDGNVNGDAVAAPALLGGAAPLPSMSPGESDRQSAPAADEEDNRRIDADAVRSLAEGCGWRTTFADGVVELNWQ